MTGGQRPKHASQAELGIRVTNLCPLGCEEADLGATGYCRHLVGFTNDGKSYEPLKENAFGYQFADGADPQKVRKGDRIIAVGISSRVYRDVDEAAKAG